MAILVSSQVGFLLDSSPLRSHSRYIATTIINEVMDGTKVIVEFDDSSMVDWSWYRYREALDLGMTGRNAEYLHVNGWVTTINIPKQIIHLSRRETTSVSGPIYFGTVILVGCDKLQSRDSYSKRRMETHRVTLLNAGLLVAPGMFLYLWL